MLQPFSLRAEILEWMVAQEPEGVVVVVAKVCGRGRFPPMRRVIVAFLVGLTSVGVTVAACKNTFSNHCFNNRADLTCIDRYGRDRPFCSGCVSENDGCVAGPVEDASCLPVPTCASSARNELTPDEFCVQETDGARPVCNACFHEKDGCVTKTDAESLDDVCLWQPEGGTGTGTDIETDATGDTTSSTSTFGTTDGSSSSTGSHTSTATSEGRECRTDDDCTGDPSGSACGPADMCVQCTAANDSACQDPTPVCDDASNTCVGCVLDDDCPDPFFADCTPTSECDPCSNDTHCAHFPDTRICEEAVCVECLDEYDCDGNICNRTNRTCTNAAPGSAGLCEPCVATVQCEPDMACVRMIVDGTDTGYFCQWLQTSCGSTEPFGYPSSKDAVEGGTAAVCSLRYASCEAYFDMTSTSECATDDECGIDMLDDARCDGTICSLRCLDANDCPEVSCVEGTCNVI